MISAFQRTLTDHVTTHRKNFDPKKLLIPLTQFLTNKCVFIEKINYKKLFDRQVILSYHQVLLSSRQVLLSDSQILLSDRQVLLSDIKVLKI